MELTLHEVGRYKAVDAADTIHHIRNILHKNKIFSYERFWDVHRNQFSSCRIEAEKAAIGTNGKGINPEFSLASAYAEFMERFQNLLIFDPMIHRKSKYDKMTYPDSRKGSISEFLNNETICRYLIDCYETDRQRLMTLFRSEGEKHDFVPFYHVNSCALQYLPLKLIKLSIGSNGMTSGNTPDEALIHGMCEIFERHVLKKIYYENLVLPDIPQDVFKNYKQFEMIRLLEKNGFEVYVKDCSMGGKFPVVGVLIKKGDKALLNLGSSPHFAIALERCITELFQGFNLKNIKRKLMPIRPADTTIPEKPQFRERQKRIDYQFINAATTSAAYVSPMLFIDNGAFESKYLWQCDSIISNETLNRIIRQLTSESHDIYIRDVSFLGFPSYYIYIPGLSEINRLDYDILEFYHRKMNKAADIFFNIDNATKADRRKLIDAINAFQNIPKAKEYDSLKKIHNLSIENNARIRRVETDNFLMMLYVSVGDFEKAAETAKNYLLSKMSEAEIDAKPDWAAYHICLFDALKLMCLGKTIEQSTETLERDYNKQIVDEVCEVLSQKHPLSRYFGIPDCLNCSTCGYQGDCNFENGIGLLDTVEHLMGQYDFNQEKLSDLFSIKRVLS